MADTETPRGTGAGQSKQRPRIGAARRVWLAGGVFVVAVVVFLLAFPATSPLLNTASDDPGQASATATGGPATPASFVPDARSIRNLVLALTEQASGTPDSEMQAIFGHPALLAAGQGDEGKQGMSIVIFVNENVHVDTFTTAQPTVWLRVDGSELYEPTASRVTRSDIHHRTVRFEWDIPGLPDLPDLIKEDHRLVLLIDPVSPGNTLSWDLPLSFSSSIESAVSQGDSVGPATGLSYLEAGAIASSRELFGLAYDGAKGIDVTATFGTRAYLESVFPADEAAGYLAGGKTTFIVQEVIASGTLAAESPRLELRIGGTTLAPSRIDVKFSSGQQRMVVYEFPTTDGMISRAAQLSLLLPSGDTLVWLMANGEPLR